MSILCLSSGYRPLEHLDHEQDSAIESIRCTEWLVSVIPLFLIRCSLGKLNGKLLDAGRAWLIKGPDMGQIRQPVSQR